MNAIQLVCSKYSKNVRRTILDEGRLDRETIVHHIAVIIDIRLTRFRGTELTSLPIACADILLSGGSSAEMVSRI